MTTTTTEKIQFWVDEFMADSDALLTSKGTCHWRVEMMAKRAMFADVETVRKLGYLLYLHDNNTLINRKGLTD